ncbi:MAG TPA: anti-sigma factor [Rikenellaceae bacterium]|nr:anti-sigma factor [Rikenellaceae bacterium]
MKTNDIKTLIERFLTGDITGEELVTLSRWTSESHEHAAGLSSRMKTWAELNSADGFDADEAFGRFRRRISLTRPASKVHRVFWKWTAAVAAIFTAVGIITYEAYRIHDYKTLYADNHITVEAPAGSKTHVVLPDGSKVWLNAGSVLKYSGDGKGRRAELSGEGFFEVSHDESRPFNVASTHLNVRVLGTKFDFRDYQDDSLAEVTLAQGKIILSDLSGRNGEIVMSPEESVVFDKSSGILTRGKAVTASDEWVTGTISFDAASLSEIARRLEREYSVKIEIADPALRGFRFYGTFNSSRQDVDEVLQSLSATGKFRYRKVHNVVTLY